MVEALIALGDDETRRRARLGALRARNAATRSTRHEVRDVLARHLDDPARGRRERGARRARPAPRRARAFPAVAAPRSRPSEATPPRDGGGGPPRRRAPAAGPPGARTATWPERDSTLRDALSACDPAERARCARSTARRSSAELEATSWPRRLGHDRTSRSSVGSRADASTYRRLEATWRSTGWRARLLNYDVRRARRNASTAIGVATAREIFRADIAGTSGGDA